MKHKLYVATVDDAGQATFDEPAERYVRSMDGVVESTWLWSTGPDATLPADVGRPPTADEPLFPPPGGTRFGIVCFPAHSAGKLDMKTRLNGDASSSTGTAPGMHRSQTLDYEVVISGKVDIELEGGETRTLQTGDCLVMGGAMHAWSNHYDEPCVYAAVVVGLTDTIQNSEDVHA